jgi:hypothetical protein
MAKTTPFLEVVTRCYKRPVMLARNQDSIQVQTCDDWEQTLLIDPVGFGVGWSSEQLGHYGVRLTGEYIWLLDDDDVCVRQTLVQELKEIARDHNPDVIMLRMDHGPRGILPDANTWGRRPVKGKIGCSAYVVKREVWQAHSGAWLPGEYSSDFNFINAVFASEPIIHWHDVIASRVQQIGLGKPEGLKNAQK